MYTYMYDARDRGITDQHEAESFSVELGKTSRIIDESRLFADVALSVEEVVLTT